MLDNEELDEYDELIEIYSRFFGEEQILHAPIHDFSIVDEQTFCEKVLPFLSDADELSEPVLVHFSAGMGRTGHVLALWLVHGKGYSLREAISEVSQSGRNPLEAESMDDLAEIYCSE